jgi:diguanylate cyclase (GGDEF)-like protein
MTEKQSGKFDLRAGSFRDKRLEEEFRAYELDSGYRSLSIVLPLLGALFLFFSLPDYFTLGAGPDFYGLLAARSLFCAIAGTAPFYLRASSPVRLREAVLVSVTAVGAGAFGYALLVYRGQNAYLQAMSVLLVINAQYLIPNRFLVSVGLSLAIAAMSVAALEPRLATLPSSAMAAIIVDIGIVSLISSLVWLRTCRARRREFAKTLELDTLAKIDPLTGLGNRRYLRERLDEAKARAERYGESFAVVMIDLDRFKALNDNFGHETGDMALRESAWRFQGALRREDSVARWGGEEFVALLSYADADAAMESTKRLQSALSAAPLPVVGRLSASFGITLLRPGEDPEDAVARADRAMYRAKDAGRDRIEFEP